MEGFSQAYMDVLAASPGKAPANHPGTESESKEIRN